MKLPRLFGRLAGSNLVTADEPAQKQVPFQCWFLVEFHAKRVTEFHAGQG